MPRPPAHRDPDVLPASSMRPNPYSDDDCREVDRLGNYEHPSNAGMIALILSLVSLGLLAIVGVLSYAMHLEDAQGANVERTRLMLYWFTLLDFLSLFIALAATIFAVRALTPTNPLYRGWAMVALLLGILEIIITAIAGFCLSCVVLVREAIRNAGAG